MEVEHAVEEGNGVVEGGGIGEGFPSTREEASGEGEERKGTEKDDGLQHGGGEGDIGGCVEQNRIEQSICRT